MDSVQDIVITFLSEAMQDHRIAPNHMSLFMAILLFRHEQGEKEPVAIHAKTLMKRAKVLSPSTYTKCIYELKEYGYIDYIPSYNPVLGSLFVISQSLVQANKAATKNRDTWR